MLSRARSLMSEVCETGRLASMATYSPAAAAAGGGGGGDGSGADLP